MPDGPISNFGSGGGSVTTTNTQTAIGGGASVGAGSTVASGDLISGQQNLQGGSLQGSSSSTMVTLGNGTTAGPITINEGSPADLALAQQALEDSKAIVSGMSGGLLDFAKKSESASQELAKNSTASTSQMFNQLLLIAGGLAVVGFGIYLYMKKG